MRVNKSTGFLALSFICTRPSLAALRLLRRLRILNVSLPPPQPLVCLHLPSEKRNKRAAEYIERERAAAGVLGAYRDHPAECKRARNRRAPVQVP